MKIYEGAVYGENGTKYNFRFGEYDYELSCTYATAMSLDESKRAQVLEEIETKLYAAVCKLIDSKKA